MRVFAVIFAVLVVMVGLIGATVQTLVVQRNFEHGVRLVTEQARGLAWMYSSMSQTLPGPSRRALETLVINRSLVIAGEQRAPVWRIMRNGIRMEMSNNDATTAFQLSDVSGYMGDILQGKEVVLTNTFTEELGGASVSVGVPYTGADGEVGGAVFVNARLSDLRAGASTFLRQLLFAALGALVGGLLLAWMVARWVTRPILEISEATHAVAQGDFNRRIDLRGRQDELGRLMSAFNDMAADLGNLEGMRRDFVANVSHELRSPMTSINGYLQGILDGVIAPEEQPRYIHIVLDETRRLSRLVSELLDLSRLESGNFPVELTRFDVNELIRQVLIKYEGRINERKQDVEVAFRSEALNVMGDPSRIEQVVTNLIDNASKFTPEGGVISIFTSDTGDTARVSISDNGPGISQDDLPFVFDRFYKADKAHSGGGTGLGLSIVQKIVESHGQRITASSAPGKGATFEFTLKRAKETGAAEGK